MNKEAQQFKGIELNGSSCGFNIRLRLNVEEKLQIYLENKENFESYFYLVKPDDIKKQNTRNHCDFIETASQIFLMIDHEQTKGTNFEDIFKVDAKGKIQIKVSVEISLHRNSKRKPITYEFQTVKQNQNGLDKLRAQLTAFTSENTKLTQQIQARLKGLEQQNMQLRNQIRDLQTATKLEPKNKLIQFQTFRFATDPNALIVKSGIFLQTANSLNIVLFGDNLAPHPKFEWKLRVCHKMLLIFGIGPYKLIQLQNQALSEEISNQKLLKKDYFLGGEIISCKFQEGELKYLIQRVDIEEEQGSSPEPNYNMKRGSLVCKKLAKIDDLFPCFGLHFGARLEILSFKAIK